MKAGYRESSILETASVQPPTDDSVHTNIAAKNSLVEICEALEEMGLDRRLVEENQDIVVDWMSRVAEETQSDHIAFSDIGPLDSVLPERWSTRQP